MVYHHNPPLTKEKKRLNKVKIKNKHEKKLKKNWNLPWELKPKLATTVYLSIHLINPFVIHSTIHSFNQLIHSLNQLIYSLNQSIHPFNQLIYSFNQPIYPSNPPTYYYQPYITSLIHHYYLLSFTYYYYSQSYIFQKNKIFILFSFFFFFRNGSNVRTLRDFKVGVRERNFL